VKRACGLATRLSERVGRHDRPAHWLAQLFMLLAASPFFAGAGLSVASGLGRLADVVWFVSLMWLAWRAGGLAAGAILSLLPLRLPRRLIGGGAVLYASLAAIFMRTQVDAAGALVLAGIILLTGYAAGSGLWLLLAAFRGRSGRRRRFAAVLRAGAGAASFAVFFGWMFAGTADPDAAKWQPARAAAARVVDASDPSAFGPYRVVTFTYGSGTDPYRPEFAEEAAIITRTADASALVGAWGWSRRWLFGADPAALPLNGRVYLPAGDPDDGPYPVVLIMHGNHAMADYSDDGYGYLGELLASRGYLAVSVDANFLNHSTWEGNLGDGGDNVAIRAWLLLQHLAEIERLSRETGNPLSGMADMERIALIGHSRGGQAAVLAAGFDDFFAEERHAAIRIGRDFGIDAVIALAPTDFPVDGRSVQVSNVHYLLLHGGSDADVTGFAGDRQYGRLAFDAGPDRFYVKASLYIANANHGQFNERWGRQDLNLPAAWLLDGEELLSGEEQRQIARVYVSAFLDTVLAGSDRYLPMFRDPAFASAWLPDALFVGRYADSRFASLADFDAGWSLSTGRRGAVLGVRNADAWRVRELTDRHGRSRENRAAELVWTGDEAALVIELPDEPAWPDNLEAEAVGLALADLTADDGELAVAVEVETRDGELFRTALEDGPPVPGPVETRFLKPFPGGLLEQSVKDGELAASAETVMQSYVAALCGGWADADGAPGRGRPDETAETDRQPEERTGGEDGWPAGDCRCQEAADPGPPAAADIEEIRIVLEREGGGTVLVDDIGLYLEAP